MVLVRNDTGKTIPFSVQKEGGGDPDQRIVWYTVQSGETVDVPQDAVRRALAHGLTLIPSNTGSPIPLSPVKASPLPNIAPIKILSKKEIYALNQKQQEDLIRKHSDRLGVPPLLPKKELDRVALILSLQSEVKQ